MSDHTLDESERVSPAQYNDDVNRDGHCNEYKRLPVGVRADQIAPEAVDWLWPGYIARGKLTILEGQPGEGKSMVAVDLAARVSKGLDWPDGSKGIDGCAILLNAEENGADTIRPRLDAAGADPSRVVIVDGFMLDENGKRRPMSLPGDLKVLEETIKETSAVLVVVDPLSAFLDGKINACHDSDIRRALMIFRDLAERCNVAIVIIRHLTKDPTNTDPMYRGGGSIGIVGAARAAFLIATDPADPSQKPRRVIANIKVNNDASPTSLAFRVVKSEGNLAANVEWIEGAINLTARDLLTPLERRRGRPDDAIKRARDFLRGYLKNGPRLVGDVVAAAGAELISKATLLRAKVDVGVESAKEGFDGNWSWSLPLAN